MVKIHEDKAEIKPSGSDRQFASSASSVCAFCSSQVGKYSCPKCARLYCSLACYKSESHRSCTEQFYKSNVQEQIKANRVNEFEKDKLKDILSKYQTDDGSGWKYVLSGNPEEGQNRQSQQEDEGSDLEEDEMKELEQLVSEASPDQLLQLLSEDQRAQFEALYRSYSDSPS
ncbi:hypothetical protein TRVA0_051S00276 [Trichomonascus vanleenenianus]|uniref:Hit1p n=1 Tax=Trichomonascus vanleenenianus TaxID=2268995 RepID=UPI003ECB5F3C